MTGVFDPIDAVLASSVCLRAFSPSELAALKAVGEIQSFSPHARLIGEGSISDEVFVLLDGYVSARVFANDDGHEIQSYEGPGAMFGHGAMTRRPASLTIMAETAVRTLAFGAESLRRLDTKHRGLCDRLTVSLSARRRRPELVEALSRAALFRNVGLNLLRQLVSRSTLAHFRPGEAICRQGEPGDTYFHLLHGEVAVVREREPEHASDSDDAGRPTKPRQMLGVLASGDGFGEGALLKEPGLRTASVIAKRQTEALIIHRPAFLAMMRGAATFRRGIIAVAEERGLQVALPRMANLWWLIDRSPCPFGVLAVALAREMESAFRERCRVVVLDPSGHAQLPLPSAQREKVIVTAFDDATPMLRELLGRPDVDRVLCLTRRGDEGRAGQQLAALHPTLIDFTEDRAPTLPDLLGIDTLVSRVVVGKRKASDDFRRQDFRLLLERPNALRVNAEGLTGDGAREAIGRLARALTNRRVGLALGGGAAWGYAHVPLIRGLLAAGVPIDLISGTSMGSLVGALFASRGLFGLDLLVSMAKTLRQIAVTALFSSRLIAQTLRRHLRHQLLEELPFPFLPVAVDIDAGVERVFASGDIALATRASSSVPAIFGPTLVQGRRYVDGAVMNNVPAHPLVERGADLILASNIVPPPPARKASHFLPTLLRELSPIARVRDAVRSIYLLYNTTGQQQAFSAAITFAPNLAPYLPTDFHRANEIIALAEKQIQPVIESAKEQYAALRLRSW